MLGVWAKVPRIATGYYYIIIIIILLLLLLFFFFIFIIIIIIIIKTLKMRYYGQNTKKTQKNFLLHFSAVVYVRQ